MSTIDSQFARATDPLRTARGIGVNPDAAVVRDRLGPRDREDFFRFRLTRRSFLVASLREYDANASLTLLGESGGQILRANFPGTGLDVLLQTAIEPGTYYLRVAGRRGATEYQLNVNAIARNDVDGGAAPTQPITTLFRDVNIGAASSDPSELVVVGNSLYFAADNGVNGRELFRVSRNGNNATRIDINNTPDQGSDPRDLVNIDGTLYFSADNGVNGRELFRITNNARRATLVADINPGAESSNPSNLINYNSTLYFSADSGVLGRELFRSDGTLDGTIRISDINPGADSSNPTDFAVVNDLLYFAANNGINGRELFRTDGTQNGTSLVADLNIGGTTTGADSSIPTDLINLNNVLYFAATGDVVGRELWRYDPATGANAQPTVVSDISAGASESSPGTDFSLLTSDDSSALDQLLDERPNRSAIVSIGNTLYFAATNRQVGRELYRSNGTARGTALVSAINAGGNSNPTSLTNINNVLYFAATGDALGNELWRYNPTARPNRRLTRISDINPGDVDSNPADFVAFGNRLVFVATTPAFGRELRFVPLRP